MIVNIRKNTNYICVVILRSILYLTHVISEKNRLNQRFINPKATQKPLRNISNAKVTSRMAANEGANAFIGKDL